MNKTLFIIDGHSLIFRMYYAFARRPMVNSKGMDTSILFGVTKYVLELIEKEVPSHLAVSFDPPGGTFRDKIYPDYKANRPETPKLVIEALEPLTKIFEAMSIPVLTIPGYEADDVIGTLAKKAEQCGFTVYMVTPDKDYGQLITENILQYKPGKSGNQAEIIGPREVCEKYSIKEPRQVIEILTLTGDSSDNVPGVHGVGEVGAGKLISQYGSVQNIYANLDKLTPRQQEAFGSARDYIGLSHELVTICTEVPVEFDQQAMRLSLEYSPEVGRLFELYEFTSLRRHIQSYEIPQESKGGSELKFSGTTPAKLCAQARKQGSCALIVEGEDEGKFSPVRKVTAAVLTKAGDCIGAEGSLEDFRTIIEDKDIDKIGYDLKRQILMCGNEGVRMGGKMLDVEVMHYLVNSEHSHKIDILSRKYLDIEFEQPCEEAPRELSLFGEEDQQGSDKSRIREAAIIAKLGEALVEDLASKDLKDLYFTMEEPLIQVLAQMESCGVKVDMHSLRQYATELGAQLEQIQHIVREMAGEPSLNILSIKQIGQVLYEKLALDPKMKAKKGVRNAYPTDEETLSGLIDRHPIVGEILEYRGIKKILSTYIEPFPHHVNPLTGKIHTTFNQAMTATGRLSCSKPNLQNIPVRTERGKEIRKAFVPSREGGVILSADYSQIELRIMAHLSGDAHLLEAFRQGVDVHAMTASRIFAVAPEDVTPEQRRIAKTANFGIMYGISSFGLSQRLKISRSAAKKIIDDYFESFPTISSYINDSLEKVRKLGYVQTLFGRRRYIPDINSSNGNVRAIAERNAINAPIQGSSADIIKKAMASVSRRIEKAGLQSRMVLQIHDELVFDALLEEVEQLRKIVVEEMENVIELSVPLTVECNYGKNWLEAH